MEKIYFSPENGIMKNLEEGLENTLEASLFLATNEKVKLTPELLKKAVRGYMPLQINFFALSKNTEINFSEDLFKNGYPDFGNCYHLTVTGKNNLKDVLLMDKMQPMYNFNTVVGQMLILYRNDSKLDGFVVSELYNPQGHSLWRFKYEAGANLQLVKDTCLK